MPFCGGVTLPLLGGYGACLGERGVGQRGGEKLFADHFLAASVKVFPRNMHESEKK